MVLYWVLLLGSWQATIYLNHNPAVWIAGSVVSIFVTWLGVRKTRLTALSSGNIKLDNPINTGTKSTSIRTDTFAEFQRNIENEALTKKALQYFIAGQYETAIAETDKIIDEDNNFSKEAYDIRAMSLESLNYNLDAIDDFTQSLTMDPSSANIYYLRGLARQKVGGYAEALEDLKYAVHLEPHVRQYQQALETLKILISNPELAEYAKEKARKKGNLNRRAETFKNMSPLSRDNYQDGALNMLNSLKNQVQANPSNMKLRELLQDSEKKYMDEFVYKKEKHNSKSKRQHN